MNTLRRGSRGPQVKLLQRLLNERRSAAPGGRGSHKPLNDDGIFGPLTEGELNALMGTKVTTPQVWTSLGVTIDITHPVRLVGQPTNMTCWSAAATMLFGNMSVGPGNASLSTSGGLNSGYANVASFAASHNLQMHPPRTWTVQGLAALLRRGPLWVGGVQPVGRGGTNGGHAVVIGAMWSNGDPRTTMLMIHDPWPPRVGSTYGAFYGDRLAGAPLMTLYVLHR